MGNLMRVTGKKAKNPPQQNGYYPPSQGQPSMGPMQPQMSYGYGQPSGYNSSMARYPNPGGMPYSYGSGTPGYGTSLSMPSSYNPSQATADDMYLSQITGLPLSEVQQLRSEFFIYANQSGVIDRQGFIKLYVASLVNTPWQSIEQDSEKAFRNFDLKKTGCLDFCEYVITCSRMMSGNSPTY